MFVSCTLHACSKALICLFVSAVCNSLNYQAQQRTLHTQSNYIWHCYIPFHSQANTQQHLAFPLSTPRPLVCRVSAPEILEGLPKALVSFLDKVFSFLGTNQAHGCCAKTVLPASLQAMEEGREWCMLPQQAGLLHSLGKARPEAFPASKTAEASNTSPQSQRLCSFHSGWHWAPMRYSVPWDHCRFRCLRGNFLVSQKDCVLLHLQQKKRIGRKSRDVWGLFLYLCLEYQKISQIFAMPVLL